jgi:hypothetical protein
MSCPRSVQDEENEETGKFRGIVFVRERKIATRLCQLIREHPELSKVGISPAVRFPFSLFFFFPFFDFIRMSGVSTWGVAHELGIRHGRGSRIISWIPSMLE